MTDLTRKRGDTFADQFTIKSESTGLAKDITGYSFVLTVDLEPFPIDATNNLFSIAGVITDATNGVVEFAPSLLQSNQVGNYYYDLEQTDSNSKIRTIDDGKYNFTQDISK